MRESTRRQYRSVAFERVDFGELGERVRGQRVVFAVDAAKEDLVGSVAVGEEVVCTVRWKHPGQTAEVVARVCELGATSLEVVMEPSGTYGDPIRHLFARRGVAVFRVSPKRSHDAAEVYDGVPSWHDVKAAGLLARLHFSGASEPWGERAEEEVDLAAAIRIMALYDGQEAANLNRLEALLARHWPELLGLLQLTSATLVKLIEAYGGPTEVWAHRQDATRLMARAGGHYRAQDTIDGVIRSAEQTIGVPMTAGELAAMKELASEIVRCRQAAQRWRRQVRSLSRSNVAANNMAPIVGQVTAAVVVAGLGDPRSYKSAKSLVKSAGANLRERSSGKHKGQLKITKRGPSDVRFYLYLAALRLAQNDPVVKAWYQRKVARDGGRYKNRAVVAVMRKLLLALWYVARGDRFDSKLLFDTRRLALP